MKSVLVVFCIVIIVGSPIWTTLIVLALSRHSRAWTILLCAFQLVIAYAVWWFFWGGGIGGEAYLSEAWQFALSAAALPIIAATITRRKRMVPNRRTESTS